VGLEGARQIHKWGFQRPPVGRFFEANMARAFQSHGLPTAVVLIEHDGNVQNLTAKYEAVRNRFKLRTIVGIDTGGDKFGAETGTYTLTVDQDRRPSRLAALCFKPFERNAHALIARRRKSVSTPLLCTGYL